MLPKESLNIDDTVELIDESSPSSESVAIDVLIVVNFEAPSSRALFCL